MLNAQTLSTIAFLQSQLEDVQRQKAMVEAQLMEAVTEKAQLATQMSLLKAAFEDRQTGAMQELSMLRATYAELKLQHEQCLASSRRLSQQHTAALQRCQQLERSLKTAELDNAELAARIGETKRGLEASVQQVACLTADLRLLQEALLTNACSLGKPLPFTGGHAPAPGPATNGNAIPDPAAAPPASLSNAPTPSLSDEPSHMVPSPPTADPSPTPSNASASTPSASTTPPAPSSPTTPTNTLARLEAVLLALVGPTLTASLMAGATVDPLDVLRAVKDCSSRIRLTAPTFPPPASDPPYDAAAAAAAAADGTTRTVFVTKLARHVTDDMLGRVFSAFGTVERSEMARRGHGSANRNFAWVRFARAEDAEAALQFFGSGEPHASRFGELLGRSSGERVVVKRTQRELGPYGGIEPPSGSPAGNEVAASVSSSMAPPAMLLAANNGGLHGAVLAAAAAGAGAAGMPAGLLFAKGVTASQAGSLGLGGGQGNGGNGGNGGMHLVAAGLAATAAGPSPMMGGGDGGGGVMQSMGRGYDGYMMCLAEGSAWPASLPVMIPPFTAPSADHAHTLLSSLSSLSASSSAAPALLPPPAINMRPLTSPAPWMPTTGALLQPAAPTSLAQPGTLPPLSVGLPPAVAPSAASLLGQTMLSSHHGASPGLLNLLVSTPPLSMDHHRNSPYIPTSTPRLNPALLQGGGPPLGSNEYSSWDPSTSLPISSMHPL